MAVFHGSIPALVTPFRGGQVDEAALSALVERQIAAGSHGLVPCGTTGESPTLSHAEHERVIGLTVEIAAGRVPVIAGAGANNTARAVELTRFAKEVGAHAALVVTPYYNKPDQAGLEAHFLAIADAVALPIIIYNIPPRSVVDMSVETMARLAEHPNIIGVKDATGDLARVALQRQACGADFIQLSGEDMTAAGYNAMGGTGCISVTANVAPGLCAALQNACAAGDYAAARALQDQLAPLHQALFLSPNPGPTKYALSRLGLCQPDLRLPLVEPNAAVRAHVDAALVHAGLLEESAA